MTKTEAAEAIAIDVVVWCRKASVAAAEMGITNLIAPTPTKEVVEGRMSEMVGGHVGWYYQQAVATGVSWKTVLKAAQARWI